MTTKGDTIPCEWCGTPVVKKRFDQRFCSRACGQHWGNKHAKWEERRDRVQMNALRKQRYHASKAETSVQRALDRSRNPEKHRARDKEKYQRNREKILFQDKQRRAANPEKYRAMSQRAIQRIRATAVWKFLLRNAKRRSQHKNVPFDLTHAWASTRWTGRCEITGIPFDATNPALIATIDRIEASKGYTQDNCRFILYALNAMRGQGTDEDLYEAAIVILPAVIKALG